MALCVRAGLVVYSPIVHTHPIAKAANIDPTDLSIWLPFHEPFMATSVGMIFAMLPSWQDSVGMAKERYEFQQCGKPIFDCGAEGPAADQVTTMLCMLQAANTAGENAALDSTRRVRL